MKGLDSLFLLA